MKDIQSFISKHSSFTENERLRGLYKEMGLYNPLSDELIGGGSYNLVGSNRNGLVVEKTSRAMAQ